MASSDLARRARRAYEMARVRAGLRATWPLLVIAPLAAALRGNTSLGATLVAAAILMALVVALVWRGGAFARGVPLGFLAGLPPLLVPVLLVATHATGCAECDIAGMGVAGAMWQECLLACSAAGLASGGLVGWRAARIPDGPRFALSAALVAGATGALGCAVVGVIGVLGVFAGLALGAAAPLVMRVVPR